MRWRDFDNLTPLPDSFFDFQEYGARRVHFIGIGGIGMSALAFVLADRKHQLSGSDANESSVLTRLRAAGVLCAIGHSGENLDLLGAPAEAVIFGSAISEDNPEMVEARERGVPCWHRAQLLAHFANNAKCSIAVSGTHGKSTTSAMIAHILECCGKNPTAILGAEYPPFGSNALVGDPDLVVVEADESDGSFTLSQPTISVVTNVEPEHLENYDNNESELWRAFEMFVAGSQKTVLNRDDETAFRRLSELSTTTHGYGLDDDMQIRVGVPGRHNQSNALAAIAACELIGISRQKATEIVAEFNGVKRRFQKLGEAGGVLVYDDYAHHPTEVVSTLRAAKEFIKRPVVAVFQPHRYSRTQQMGRDFGPSFECADKLIITQLYSAFEEPIEGVSGEIVFDAARESFPEKEIYYVQDLDEAKALALKITEPGDVLFTMGAGDVTTLGPRLLQELETRNPKPETRFRSESLARRTAMKIGGPAKIWIEPQSEDELQMELQTIARDNTPLFILGAGSNLLIGDEGFDGAVLHLGKGFAWQRVEGDRLHVGGAAMLPKLTHFALQNNLGNMEWACGVPGSLGGSLRGNAGARGFNGHDFESRDCAADLESAVVFTKNGERRELKRSDIEFAYRRSSLGEFIVVAATFALKTLSAQETERHRGAVKELLARRRSTQPVSAACAGCIWKNPKVEGCAGAGALIEELGLKGFAIGGAQVSEIHGNFIINTGDATGEDVRKLIEHVEAQVLAKSGIALEREVRIIGL